MVNRLLMPPTQSFFLFGPRGTGKSTWIRDAHPDSLRIDLLNAGERHTYTAAPQRLRDLVGSAPDGMTVVIDEVQRVPELLPEVHALIESRPGLRFILSGSSARKLRRTGVDLLAGRALMRTMHPLLAAELGESFDLDRALRHGLVPLVWFASQPEEMLRAYAGLYVQEEVLAEGILRNVSAFSRFLEGISFSHGAVLSATNVSRECQVERKTVEAYISILEDLLLGWRLPPFLRRAQRRSMSHHKFYYFDAGVFRSIRPTGPLDRPAEIDGAALEGLVAQHLRAWIAYGSRDVHLHYWRDYNGAEVDFVLYGADCFHAIEVKNSSRVDPHDLRGLRAFRRIYPECRTVLLYRGRERLVLSDALCIPVSDFLRALHPGHPLPV